MKNKEFIADLSDKLNATEEETTGYIESLVSTISEELTKGNAISIDGFGTFDVKKKEERVIVNPTTQQRMLVPPKLAITFNPSPRLKEKYK